MNGHNHSPQQTQKPLASRQRSSSRKRRYLRANSKGQALVIIALSMVVLILFVGLGVDAANLMGRKAKLQSAVDVATLSAAQMLADDTNSANTQPDVKAKQVLEANGVPNASLATPLQVTVNAPLHQVSVNAVQQVDTFFMRIIPAWRTVNISAVATADLNSYAEVDAKPFGFPGVVTQLNLMVWGADSRRHNGDDYSPYNIYSGYPGYPGTNSEHQKQPYGYMYRVSVPVNYAYPDVVVQLFDPDSYNRPGAAPTWTIAQTCVDNYPPGTGQTCTPSPQPNPNNPDMYANCGNPRPVPPGTNPASAGCTGSSTDPSNPAMKLNGFPDRNLNPDGTQNANGRPAFWRVDELRLAYDEAAGNSDLTHATNTKFSLYHFDPSITSAFGNPNTLADNPIGGPIATYTVRADPQTDLRWFQPPGFKVHLADYAQELNGQGWSFYLFVEGLPVPSGSPLTDRSASENNYDLRAGPPHRDNTTPGVASNDACNSYAEIDATDSNGYPSSHCYVNKLYFDQMNYLQSVPGAPDVPDWTDGGVRIFAKRALPLNLDTGTQFPMRLTQVNKNAAGQVLQVRHFDQDCGGAYPCNSPASTMTYQMQICDSPYGPDDDRSYDSVHTPNGAVVYGHMSANDLWDDGTNIAKELVQIPTESNIAGSDYVKFFGADGHCSSWLRIYRYPSSANDTSVWEIPYIRPRLIK